MDEELIREVNRQFYEAMRTYYVLSRSASVQGGNAMDSFKAGDRVESGIDGGQVWGRTDSGKYFTAEVAKLELE